jgi:mannose-6-phosphate isomerase-like protein (cupin superfamily)
MTREPVQDVDPLTRLIDALNQLLRDVELYKNLLWSFPGEMNVGVELTDTGETATIRLGEDIQIDDGLTNPDIKTTMSIHVLNQLLRGEADAMALGGRGRLDEDRPINFEFYSKDRLKEAMEALYTLATFFFNPQKIKMKKLTRELGGEAHGAHPVPLVYWNGLRSAWFFIDAGETLNAAGEKDPYPQLFVLVKGKARAIIGETEINLTERSVVYIPADSLHKVIADEAIELLWIAWNASMF